MTSGVKLALPQVLAPKAGVEGRSLRNLAPHGDFADTLAAGKVATQPKAVQSKDDQQDAVPPGAWPRLTAKLGTAIDRMQGSRLAIEPADPDVQHAAEQSADDVGIAVEDVPETAGPPAEQASGQALDTVQAIMSYSQAAPVPVRRVDARNPDAMTAASDGRDMRVAPGVPGEDGHAIARADGSIEESAAAGGRNAPHSPASPWTEPAVQGAADAADKPPRVGLTSGAAAAVDVAVESDRNSSEGVGDAAKPAPRPIILSQQNIPAPMPSTSILLAESIAASDLLPPVNALARDAIHASATHVSAQSLKIQLHPAELGMVTATLRFAGEQLSIELQVENQEAHRRLSSDSETIVKSLRDLGYDIERVTISQPTIGSSSGTRADGNSGVPSPQGRAPDQFGSGAANGGGAGAGGRQSEQGENPGHSAQKGPLPGKEAEGSGLYI
ncbi:flagellar hook-length control protein FliK [Mesorhizobium sp. KR9-304]|uniref:flagellar hook-length control protein FliK n=1 Tax=Mesorhizobium sp. KR9-304 TaxID=3156614 RepID=UPI0032B524DD